jgi:hypothetical protein|tara:strand:+ start:386 stop:619 length:234 start_codon:yes stop_codon:yes gene_type:complete
MKEKIITLTPKGISQKQWSSFLLELNLMKKAWKPYGVNVEIKASGLRNVLKWGTTVHDDKKTRRTRKSLPQDQEAEV